MLHGHGKEFDQEHWPISPVSLVSLMDEFHLVTLTEKKIISIIHIGISKQQIVGNHL